MLGAADTCVGYVEAPSRVSELTAVTDLTARLRIERCAIEHDDARLRCTQFVTRLYVVADAQIQTDDLGRRDGRLVSEKLDTAVNRYARADIGVELARRASAFALLFHRALEPSHIDGKSSLSRDVGRQIRGKSEGIVEPEHDLARNGAGIEPFDRFVQHLHGGMDSLRACEL